MASSYYCSVARFPQIGKLTNNVVHVVLLFVGQHLLDAVVGVADGLEDGLDLLHPGEDEETDRGPAGESLRGSH